VISVVGKCWPHRAVSSATTTVTASAVGHANAPREIAAPNDPKGGAVILVTNKDGSTTALNVDRIERVELNNMSQGHESNIYLVDGRRLVVEEPPDTVVEQIVDAKARVIARALALTESEWKVPTEAPGQMLRILPRDGDPV
jgi:uncharacterized protein YlzI (FlbEa/FlbD family)